jgi:hypothetical protein
MHEQHRRGIARAFVEMVDSQARTVLSVDHLAVMRRKIKAIQAGKAFVRRAQDLHGIPSRLLWHA